MEWISGMNAAVNYLEEHILEEPDLEKLGRFSGCSAHHFQRIFTDIGGVTLILYQIWYHRGKPASIIEMRKTIHSAFTE